MMYIAIPAHMDVYLEYALTVVAAPLNAAYLIIML
jgi:hypothetical protein